MKVRASNGKLYTRDHPHEILSPHVMTFETIRNWMVRLTESDYGWQVAALERTLGMPKDSMRRKLTLGWIWPKEQVRFTARINDILEGRIVPRKFGARQEGVYVDPPQPPTPAVQPRVLKFQTRIKGLPFSDKAPRSPDFKGAFQDVAYWDPDKKKPAS